ncbi:MAG: DNRLRE domain-containing protein [Kiritimatiellae bacterium]|nr:DNRLRE domain-containing protein [Kiritimatiellia bacterium]
MKLLPLAFPGLLCLLSVSLVTGLENWPPAGLSGDDIVYVVPIEVESVSDAPVGITFRIHNTAYALDVYRKLPHETSWGNKITTISAGTETWTHNATGGPHAITVGTAYEYRFHAQGVPSAWDSAHVRTHVMAGINVARSGPRGRVVLVMPESIQEPLAPEIARFKQDLVGDGWTVHDVLTPDGRDNWTCAQDGHHVGIRNEIIGIYNAHPGEVKHVILLGRVPQPRSGQRVYYRPDGHGDLGAVAADMYYADVDNTWTDSLTLSSPGTVNNAWQNVPGDGRFDQSHFRHLTEAFEMGWGRIDFRGSVNGGDEIGALRNYLDKLHDYKHAQNGFVPGRRSIVRDAGSLYKHVQEEFWKTITPLSGMENLEYITGNDLPNSAGQPEAQYTYDNGPYLYFFMAGNEPNQPSDNSRAVFWTGFKSHMGYHDLTSWTRSRLAEPNGWTLSWTFAPPRGRYVYHRMALGGTIGDMMKATINNQNSSSGLYGSAVKNYINGAWTVQSPSGATNDYAGYTFHNHMGDPPLRDQMIASPSWVRGRLLNGGSQVHVEWQASPDATHGYDVYSAPDVLGPFTKRNGSALDVNATSGELSWTDTAPPSDPVVYMVRALKMEDTPSGSYLNASVGRMVEVDRSPAPFAIVTAELPNAYLGSSYDVQLETSGGNPPAIWTVTSGTLPSGLSLSSSGRITGTPANAGAFTLTLQAEDLLGATQSRSFTLDVDMFSTWTLLPNGDFAAPPHNTGSVNQWFSGNWQHPATPNSQWDYDAENQWAVTYRDGRTGAQPGLVYVYQDDFAQTGAVSFRHDLINTDGSGKPNTMYVRIYGINGDFSWDHWNLGSNPSGDATLLHISEITGSFDWTTFETPALPVGDGYEFYVLRFYPTDVTTAEGDFMAIDNLYMSAAAPPPVFYDVTFSAGTNGSLEGTLSQTLVGGGSTEAVTAVPDPGYELSQWTWTGGGTSTDNPLVIANVSDDLAVTAHFQLFNNPPVSAITSPEDGASFPVNTAISFNGTGSDPEDGEITDAVWESSIDGVFEPVGGSYSGLSHGEHSIIRTVTDSGGKTGSDSITLTILEPLVRVAVADAMVRGDGGNADTNYGSATTIRTRSSESAEGLYRFDVDNVPGTLLSATLRLNLSANDTGAINVMEVADNSWGEMTVTYNTRPDYGEIIGQMSGEGVGQNNFMELDVTNYVLSRLPDGQASFATTGTGMLVRVNSREVAAAERHPQLVIVYTLEDINLEPLVEITSPANETVVFAGDEVIFEGTALDPEDGDLTAAAVWTSSLDGPLGSGGALSLDTLSVGEHLITLSATDSGNATGSDQIVLTVLEPATTETVILVAEADTDVRGDNPDTNYGESTVLRTRGSQQHESLYRFDLSGVSGTIVSATLQLTLSANDTGTLDIHGIADNSWEEMTVTFNTKPAYGDVIAQMVTGGVSGTQHEADVTAYVAAQLAEGKVSFATTSANFVRMQSREVSTEANRPQLTVVYSVGETSNTPPTVAITAPADNTTVTEGDSVTFTGTATDAEDGDITANATWTSSLDGALGSGGSVSTTTLSPGIHTVTFEVTDSGGLSDMEQISLTVEAAPSVPAVPPGYVSVLDFGADPSGQTDSTAALQDAINHGIAHQVAVWFPAGEYRISERLIADQPDDDPDYPAVLIGSTADPSQRAVIVLAANSPGFNNPDARRVMLHFFNRGTADNESGENTLYNQAVIVIDFGVESGNDGAVALRMQGAE